MAAVRAPGGTDGRTGGRADGLRGPSYPLAALLRWDMEATDGDCGRLGGSGGSGGGGASLLMMSCMEASSASTRLDICVTAG